MKQSKQSKESQRQQAMSIYLPTLMRNQFLMSPQVAGMGAAFFVIVATFVRPLGGYLSDRWGAGRILLFAFLGIAGCSLLLMNGNIAFFGFGAVCFAVGTGLGNGAVFKLVPHYFPHQTGTVTGLVGAAGGMGGFFPPLLMGFSLQNYGHYYVGWVGLLIFSIACTVILWKVNADERRITTLSVTNEEVAV